MDIDIEEKSLTKMLWHLTLIVMKESLQNEPHSPSVGRPVCGWVSCDRDTERSDLQKGYSGHGREIRETFI
jgi:hypothetical protein